MKNYRLSIWICGIIMLCWLLGVILYLPKVYKQPQQRPFIYFFDDLKGEIPGYNALQKLHDEGWRSVRETQLAPGSVLMILERKH